MKCCCANCFGDRYLKKEVIPKLTAGVGECSYCGSKDQQLVEPSALRDSFELLVSIYSYDDDGEPLVEWFKKDWAMFEHDQMDHAHAKELLADILDDGEIVRRNFKPSKFHRADALDGWEGLRSELMHENRFFPETDFDIVQLAEFLPHLKLDPDDLQIAWYRARLQETDTPFTAYEMGAPSKLRASHGRANPAGIPYLYLASNAATAISEIRPHTGELASIAEFSVPNDLKIVDLRDPRRTVSPFRLDEEDSLELLRGGIGFLEKLGDELTRPVLPQSAAVHYIPTQYLCEFVKRQDYDGVMYRSSVGDGVNVALFYPERATVGIVTQRRVSRVSVELED